MLWTSKFIKIIQRFFPGCINTKMKTKILKNAGIDIGEGTVFFNAGSVTVDTSRPALLKIGKYCKITGGTIILTHDYSRSVLRMKYGDVVGEARKTTIGDNVFIGMNSIILMGTTIGNNCIVGAGSVCHGSYPDNSVIAGNPAKIICSLDNYYKKRKSKSIDEAKLYAKLYFEKFDRFPTIAEMGAFFPLYLKRNTEELKKHNIRTNLSGDIEEEVINGFLSSKPLYNSYEEFIEECKFE